MLRRIGHPHRYLAIDTFAGFVDDQFAHDQELGTPASDVALYDQNSIEMVRRLLDYWGAPEVELLQADIASLADDELPEKIAVGLVDVDLELPVYEALRRVWPRLQVDGIVLVDDCPAETTWVGARLGYRRFVEEIGVQERYVLGVGLLSSNA
jgi:hypothetical protein